VVTTINFILCLIILGLGIWAYVKKKDDVPLYIAIAFGLFGISHLMTIMGMAGSLETILIVIRLAAYVLVIVALWRILARK